ncbi:MAG: hypothetical protein LBD95_01515 [Clostridiales Family XIII bacterium]|nr:hypothetical protein [Clostridiales Family XIII bacterium]
MCDAIERTNREIGFLDVLSELRPHTPFGRKRAAAARAFVPGEEAALEAEYDRLEGVRDMLAAHGEAAKRITELFDEIKDLSHSLTRCGEAVLSTVELFEIKVLLLHMEAFADICKGPGAAMPDGFTPEDTSGLLKTLDPEGAGMPTFYIYDLFSERLAALRKRKKEKERLLRADQKRLADAVYAAVGVSPDPSLEAVIARSDEAAMAAARRAPQLYAAGEDLYSVRFALVASEEARALTAEAEALAVEIEEAEAEVRAALTDAVCAEAERILRNCNRIGALDFLMAKAAHALRHACVRPVIVRDCVLRVEEGRHLPTERALREKGRVYRPVGIDLSQGVSCVTGANMGGKTVSVKLVGLVAAMARHGLFVPCKSAVLGLPSSISILIGDNQDLRKGLSSFGSEMEGLNAILAASEARALILIDEIAGATNPDEGRALTGALIAHLSRKPCITLMTTHFDRVAGGAAVANYRVRGLSGAALAELATALRDAAPGERLEAIGALMDYRLERVSGESDTPKDAIRIAEILGVNEEIIALARDFMDVR